MKIIVINDSNGNCNVLEVNEEELADIVIRAMDTAVVLGIDLGEAIARKSEYNRQRPFRNGEKLA